MGRGTKTMKESFSEMGDRWRASAREEDPSGVVPGSVQNGDGHSEHNSHPRGIHKLTAGVQFQRIKSRWTPSMLDLQKFLQTPSKFCLMT
jgi:hypothetical protein